jgi:hypothetical protein
MRIICMKFEPCRRAGSDIAQKRRTEQAVTDRSHLTESPTEANGWPTSLPELDPAERLVVWAFRCWAVAMRDRTGHRVCLVSNEFARQLGRRDGEAAFAACFGLLRALREHARRNIRHHQPGCACLGADELWLVCLVGSCQRGDGARARFLAEWMVQPDGVCDLLEAGSRLGRSMLGHDMALPHRGGTGFGAACGSRTIH